MPATRTDLEARLTELDIAFRTIEHPPAFTVSQASDQALDLPGAHTKNLFLKDEHGTLVLVVAKSTTAIDLKALPKKLGTGRLSFANADVLMANLGVTPGSVTAFAVVNDTSRRVNVVFDQELLASDTLNCHPLENTATTNIARDDLLRFIRSTGHEPRVLTLPAPGVTGSSGR